MVEWHEKLVGNNSAELTQKWLKNGCDSLEVGSINSCTAVITSWFIRGGCGWLTLPALGVVNEQTGRWKPHTRLHTFRIHQVPAVFSSCDNMFFFCLLQSVADYSQNILMTQNNCKEKSGNTSSWDHPLRRAFQIYIIIEKICCACISILNGHCYSLSTIWLKRQVVLSRD